MWNRIQDIRLSQGGESSGSAKSFSVNTVLSLMMLEDNRTILFLRKTLVSAHLSIIPEFIEKLDTLGIRHLFHITKTEIVNKLNGSAMYFRGIQSSSGDNTANLKSIANVSVMALDEAEELTDEKTFDAIDLSIRSTKQKNRIFLMMNPSTKNHWIFSRFFENMGVNEGFNGVKDDVTYIHTTYLDNIEHLSDSFIRQANSIKKNNPKKYHQIMLGSWLDRAEGVIFENWKLGKFVELDNITYGQDYGFSIDPTTLVKVSLDKSNRKAYLKELVYKQGLSTDDIYNLNRHYAKEGLIIGDSAEPRLISELKQRGLNIKGATKGQGSVTGGISLMQDYELIIDPDSTNLIKELNNYAWSDRKSGTPIDMHNHILDGVRYIFLYQHQNNFVFSIG